MLFLSNLLFLENLHLPANIMCPCDINNILFEIFPVAHGIEHISGTSKKSRCTVYFHQAVCNCLKGFADMSSTIVIQITLLRVIPTMTFIHFLTGKSSGILSDISSDILFDILSGISSGK